MKTAYKDAAGASPLRLARLAAGLRLRDVGEKINRSAVFVWRLEHGRSARLNDNITEQLAELLDIPRDILTMGGRK